MPRYRGRHRKPTHTGRNTAALAATGALAVAPMALTAGAADAAPDWGPIIACESGGNPAATNPNSTASGLFQFLDSTWRSVGGTGRAKDASAAEQYARANKLFAQSGLTPWNASKPCWAGKVSSASTPAVKPAPKAKPKTQAKPAKPYVGRHRAPETPAAPAAGSYVVKSGDTLSGIAFAHGDGDWHRLAEKNRAAVPNPDLIFPGQRLSL